MSRSAVSVFVFGIYLLLLGAVLVIVPNVLLTVFFVPPTNEVWIRVVGMLILFLGVYYVLAAHAELRQFFPWTVYVRSSVIVFSRRLRDPRLCACSAHFVRRSRLGRCALDGVGAAIC